ncbi:YagK/YfjJ domain-containing protein [Pseudoalteromonas arctica]|uniref:YagK/YfjJ domain-containing protein n=1 Tax=Pseudoalteromonas arctica TaxID=394751 RepID=UPI0024958985|nr:inovirus-type Gp2 protein [Pseudoalteromonas arctica]
MTFKITATNSLEFLYKDHSYRVFKPKTKGQDLKALTKVFKHCEGMLSHYSKVLVARIDLSTNSYSINNQAFLAFIKKQLSILTKQYNSKVSYVCARERNTSLNHHYHLAILLSGHKINHSYTLTNQLKHAWESEGLGSASFVKHPYYVMQRGNKQSIEPALYRLSYLTKLATKEMNIKAHSYLFNKLDHFTKHDSKRFTDILLVDPAITYKQKTKDIQSKSKTARPSKIHTNSITQKSILRKIEPYKCNSVIAHTDHFIVGNNDHLTIQYPLHRKYIGQMIDHFIYIHIIKFHKVIALIERSLSPTT